MVNDIGKIILLTAGLLSGVGLAITGVIVHDSQALTAGVGMAMGVIGYMTGNGVLAARGEPPSPAYVPRHEKVAERVATKVAKRVLDQAKFDEEHDQP